MRGNSMHPVQRRALIALTVFVILLLSATIAAAATSGNDHVQLDSPTASAEGRKKKRWTALARTGKKRKGHDVYYDNAPFKPPYQPIPSQEEDDQAEGKGPSMESES